MKKILALLALFAGQALGAPAISSFTVTPSSAISPATVTVAWNASGAASCTAGGTLAAWTGTKALTGSQQLTGVVWSATPYSLTLQCGTTLATVTVSWTLPVQNTDGTPIPASGTGSLTNIKLFRASTVAGVPTGTVILLPGDATSHALDLPAGPHSFGAKATNTFGTDSNMSNVASTTAVVPAPASASATLTITPKPGAPVIIDPIAYSTKPDYTRLVFVKDKPVGTALLGAPCNDAKPIADSYYAINRQYVTWSGGNKPANVVAKCEG